MCHRRLKSLNLKYSAPDECFLSLLLYANEEYFLFGLWIVRSIDTAMIREIDSETGPLNVDLKGALLKKSISALPKSWKPMRRRVRCRDAREIQEDTFVLARSRIIKAIISYVIPITVTRASSASNASKRYILYSYIMRNSHRSNALTITDKRSWTIYILYYITYVYAKDFYNHTL